MNLTLAPGNVEGLGEAEKKQLSDLIEIYEEHTGKNETKNRYYEGHITLDEVNLGIALPDGLKDLEIGCSWGAKCVDVLAARSMFTGFVGANGAEVEALSQLVRDNRLPAEYMKACRDELLYGTTFTTLSADPVIGAKIRWHSPRTAAGRWDGDKGRISCGFAVIDTVPDEEEEAMWIPSIVYLYTDDALWDMRRDGNYWTATPYRHRMGRPLMEPLIWNSTSNKPFGRSRIKEPIRRLIQGYVRTIANATIGLEFSTTPQKYLLGLTDDQYDVIINQKFKQYVGSILASTTNPETGEKPTFGQLMQGTISPHVEMLRVLATQFSAATGLTVTDTGVVSEANPTSAEAVLAQSQTLVAMAEQLNTGNGDSLRSIALMALAIMKNKGLDELTPEEKDVIAHFRNPAMPSISSTADAAIKIASAREGFSATDTFLEMIGFDQADIRRIRAQEQRARGNRVLEEMNK